MELMAKKLNKFSIDSDGWYSDSKFGNWVWYPDVLKLLKSLQDESEEEHF